MSVGGLSQFLRILHYRSRSHARWLRNQAYSLGILGPLILAGVYLIVEPYLSAVGRGIRSHLVGPPECLTCLPDFTQVSLALSLTIIGVSLPTALHDVYAFRSPESYLDALPISEQVRFQSALVVRFGKILLIALMLLLLALPLAPNRGAYFESLTFVLPGLAAAVASLAILEVLLVLVLVHFDLYSIPRFLLGAAILVGLAAWTGSHRLFFVPFAPLITPILYFNAILSRIATGTHSGPPVFASFFFHLPVLLLLYGMTSLTFGRWHHADRERAAAAASRRSAFPEKLAELSSRSWGAELSAQVIRDLALTRRGFSISVYLAASCAALFQFLFVVLSRSVDLGAEDFNRLAGACCAASAFSLASLGPLLLKFQLPYFWVEKAGGLAPDKIWRAKLWYARIVTAPALLSSAVLAAGLHPGGSVDRLLVTAKLVLVTFVVSSFVGFMTFEIAEHPLLGLSLAGIAVGTGTALCLYYWLLWPVWIYVYFTASHALGERARLKAWLTEVGA